MIGALPRRRGRRRVCGHGGTAARAPDDRGGARAPVPEGTRRRVASSMAFPVPPLGAHLRNAADHRPQEADGEGLPVGGQLEDHRVRRRPRPRPGSRRRTRRSPACRRHRRWRRRRARCACSGTRPRCARCERRPAEPPPRPPAARACPPGRRRRDRAPRARPSARSPARLGGRDRHATPTSTSRKRAGAAPWETRMSWPGSPLPQLSRPCRFQACLEQMASRPPQNCGVTPA